MTGRAPKAALAVALILLVSPLAAGTEVEQLKAVYVFKAIKYFQWPAVEPGAPLRIGVIGTTGVALYLREIASLRMIGKRSIELKEGVDLASACPCDVVFLGSDVEPMAVLADLVGQPVLTVSDSTGWGERGVQLNLRVEGARVRLEVNPSAVEAAGLGVSSKLLSLARRVETTTAQN